MPFDICSCASGSIIDNLCFSESGPSTAKLHVPYNLYKQKHTFLMSYAERSYLDPCTELRIGLKYV